MLTHFYFSGRVASYLHPSFHVLTGMSGVILVLLAGLPLLAAWEDRLARPAATLHDQSRRCETLFAAILSSWFPCWLRRRYLRISSGQRP